MAQQGLVPNNYWRLSSLPSLWDVEDWDNLWNTTSNAAQAGGLSISDDDQNVYVEAPMPGIDPKEVEITFEKGMLWIRGEAKQEENNKNKKYYRRGTRQYSYQVAIPGEINPNAEIEADYQNGMVLVTLPKTPQSQPKKITVKAGKSDGKRK